MEFFILALPIHREVRDRSGVATTLSNIGAVYGSIGQPQKALEFFILALPIHREVRDHNFNIADAALLGLKNTDLVVLSACQTAIQANSNGEEFAGIAYLFERAGASAVIATLWSVADKETKDLMIEFYQNLKKGMTRGEALRQAKISLIELRPFYWSPFILIGDAR